jgi:hypothetical protein
MHEYINRVSPSLLTQLIELLSDFARKPISVYVQKLDLAAKYGAWPLRSIEGF